MLTDKATEILNQTIFNMKKIDEACQPVNGTDTDMHKVIRVMAQAIAFLSEIIKQADDELRKNEASIQERLKEAEEMFPFIFKEGASDETH